MNRVAYSWGVVAVLASMSVVVLVRSYTDSAVLAAWGAAGLPWLLALGTGAFVLATVSYGALARRRSPASIDLGIGALLLAAVALAPALFSAGRGVLMAHAVLLTALTSVANLAAWNAVAATVRGRAARTFLPRAGAAATAGAMLAGFGGAALVRARGAEDLLVPALALTGVAALARLVVDRRLEDVPLPALPPPRAQGLRAEARALVAVLSIAAFLEAVAGGVADVQLKAFLAASLPRDGIASFLAVMFGVTNAAVLILQVVVVPRLLATRSLATTLSAAPAAQVAAFALAAAVPGLASFAVVRGSDQVLKFSLARAGQEIALSPLPPAEGARWKMLLRGGVTQLGATVVALALLAAPSLPVERPALVAGLGLCAAAAWLVANRRAAKAYLGALGTSLGLRRLEAAPPGGGGGSGLDRDGLAAVLERAAAAGPDAGRLARAVVPRLVARGLELTPHLEHRDPVVRAIVYAELEARPDRGAAHALVRRAAAERDAGALVAALPALGAHGEAALVAGARRWAAGEGEGTAPAVAAAARAYLAEVADGDAAWPAFREQLGVAGPRAARLARRALGKGGDEAPLAEALLAGLGDAAPERRRQACLAAAALAGRHPAAARAWARALARGEPAAALAVAGSDAAGLEALLAAVRRLTETGEGSARLRARLARGLRLAEDPSALRLLVDLLADGDPGVREAAARALAQRARAGRGHPPAGKVAAAVGRELDALEALLAARAPAGARPELHETEIAAAVGRSLGRALELVGLLGHPAVVAAASRRLLGDHERERRGALDLLQEVAERRLRTRLLAVVERFLAAPGAPPDAVATAAATADDPWLGRVLAGELDAAAWRLAALRRSAILRDVPGPALAVLAERGQVVDVAAGDAVVRTGEPGDALYVVHHGALRMKKGGDDAGTLGPGDGFGELALVDGKPRAADVIAESDAQLLRVPREVFDEVLGQRPELGLGLLSSLVRWLRASA